MASDLLQQVSPSKELPEGDSGAATPESGDSLAAPLNTFDSDSHIYKLNGLPVPSVTQVLKSVGLIDDSWFTEASAWRGSVIHMVCQLDNEGDLDEESVAPEVAGYLAALRAFKRDTCFVPELIERSLFSTLHHFAGTPDIIGKTFDGRHVVVDLKSGAIQKATRLQLSAYQILAVENGITYIPYRVAVRLQPGGRYRCTPYSSETTRRDRDLFLSALTLHRFKETQ